MSNYIGLFVTFLIIWVIAALAGGILFSVWAEYNKAKAWTKVVTEFLYQNANVRYEIAVILVDRYYPLHQVMYSLNKTSPAFGATKMFWNMANDHAWRPVHFNDRRLPDVLYIHPTWGGIVVEA